MLVNSIKNNNSADSKEIYKNLQQNEQARYLCIFISETLLRKTLGKGMQRENILYV